jgi:hypothetical protein
MSIHPDEGVAAGHNAGLGDSSTRRHVYHDNIRESSKPRGYDSGAVKIAVYVEL